MSVPELHAKKIARQTAWEVQRAADATEARKHAKETRRVIFKKAAQYVSEYRAQVNVRQEFCAGRLLGGQSAEGYVGCMNRN